MARKSAAEKFRERGQSLWEYELQPRVRTLLELSHPPPYTGRQLYKYGWTEEQRKALVVLAPMPDLMTKSKDVHVVMPSHISAILHMEQALPVGRRSNGFFTNRLEGSDLPSHVYQEIMDWVERVRPMRLQHAYFGNAYFALLKECGTKGQLLGSWPELEPFWNKRNQFDTADSRRIRKRVTKEINPSKYGDVLAALYMIPEPKPKTFSFS